VTSYRDKTQQLEYSFFITISIIGAFAALFLFLFDLIHERNLNTAATEVLGFMLFVFGLLQARQWKEIRWLGKMLTIGLYLLINFAIAVDGGGFNFINTIIFFLVFMIALIITGRKDRPVIFSATFINLGILLVIEYFFPEIWSSGEPIYTEPSHSFVFKILLFLTGGFLVIFLKSKYEKLSEELLLTNQEIISTNRDLEYKVDERTEDLLKLNRELDLLFYRSSHYFRRPLTTLKGLNEVARLSRIDPEGMQLMKLTEDTVNQMDEMLKKFYMLYEISSFQPNGHKFSLNQVIDDLKKTAREQGHLIDARISLIHYRNLDARNKILRIILENLVENAMNYKRENRASILIEIFESNREINIKFEDNGIGIDESYFNRIFDMYFRGTELSRGNGLGLYVVKSGIEKLGGRIQLKSEPGNFTRFEISYPI
jgi:signal transduction histidine kinase